ncbi:MAG: hypothetical protein E3J72_08605 [Planctomycetota bacterium]|nr:MAG: hypothetical protein E3J72_08605 [Planctomycetota bacterium]
MFTFIVFIIAGALTGLITTYALDMKTRKELAQGTRGGVIRAKIRALLGPKKMSGRRGASPGRASHRLAPTKEIWQTKNKKKTSRR